MKEELIETKRKPFKDQAIIEWQNKGDNGAFTETDKEVKKCEEASRGPSMYLLQCPRATAR